MSNNTKSKQIFARLTKVDVAKRQVTGVIANESKDADGEIFDYDTSKPNFEAWSGSVTKATGGKSVGNLRAMHGKVAAGLLNEITFDDVNKAIAVTAEVVDNNEWEKIEKGVYTGFSIGGKYANKWDDPIAKAKRYTAMPSEVSLADIACNADCMFEVVKTDGSTEMRKYLKAEPVVVEPVPLTLGKAHYDTLVAMLPPEYVEALGKAFKIDEPAKPAPTLEQLVTAMVEKAKTDAGAASMLKTITQAHGGTDDLKKGLWSVESLCCVFRDLGYAVDDARYEAAVEGDNSKVPAMLSSVLKSLGDALIAMVKEEVSEIVVEKTTTTEDLNKTESTDDLAKSAPAAALRKALGVDDDTPVAELLTKAAGLAADLATTKETLGKTHAALDEVTNGFTTLNKAHGELLTKAALAAEEITKLKATPALPQPRGVHAVAKSADDGSPTNEKDVVRKADGTVDEAATALRKVHAGGAVPLEEFINK